ncbi:uncharacterized protein LOC104666368 [Rhinopithecus roxellana]|uniref:uncharacterized protein LOC104666368 n=1 Tax=Rhinopithecus roxellana TaxID=61622 RepID=UPI00123736E9|nr:uncharacterized protein LOC104666368 [Rhinopithecus roxellana]
MTLTLYGFTGVIQATNGPVMHTVPGPAGETVKALLPLVTLQGTHTGAGQGDLRDRYSKEGRVDEAPVHRLEIMGYVLFLSGLRRRATFLVCKYTSIYTNTCISLVHTVVHAALFPLSVSGRRFRINWMGFLISEGGRWGWAGPLSVPRVPGRSLQDCGSLQTRSFRARGAGPRGQAVPAPGKSGPISSPSPAPPAAALERFPLPATRALSPPAPRRVSGSGSGRRRCRWGRTGDGPGAQQGCELEAAVQKSRQVSSAGSGGSWSRGQEDPRGRSPPGTNGHGCEGLDELGGRGHRWCGALGPVMGAFPGTGYTLFSWVLKNNLGN